MKRKHLIILALISALAVPAFGRTALRRTVVMYEGQTLAYTAAGSLITINPAEGSSTDVIGFRFDQYGQTVRIEALKKGEVKLLLEYTTRRVEEILHVVVADRTVAVRYRNVLSAMSGTEGIKPETIQVVGGRLVMVDDLYAYPDLELCENQQKSGPKKGEPGYSVCAARLSSAAPSVFPQFGYQPRASIELLESATTKSTGDTEGIEGQSTWSATIRLGDIPVATLADIDRVAVLDRAVDFVENLNRVAASWKANADDKGVAFPATFSLASSGTGYEVRAQWNADQGSRGDLLATIPVDLLELAASSSSRAPDLLMQWWTSILQDAFRLYFMAQRPLKTATETTQSPLIDLYQRALEVRQADIDRASAPTALARGYFSLSMTSPSRPFDKLLISPPAEFAQSALQSR